MAGPRIYKTVWLARHGQSEDNARPVYQSVASPLSEHGQWQAARLAARLAHTDFDLLISSPLKRAAQTAQVIAQACGYGVDFNDMFVERIKPVSIDGKPHSDARAAQVWEAWEDSLFTPGLRVEDGENYDDMLSRAGEALAFLDARPETAILVVTHGFFLRTLVTRILLGSEFPAEAYRRIHTSLTMQNAGLTVLRYHAYATEPPQWRLWTHNDGAHLDVH